ncbi:LOW QUALITY PROTEIN: lysozyme [Aphomia sociella]
MMASAVIKFSAIMMLIAVCVADVSELPEAKAAAAAPPVTEVCLGCICQAVSGCKQGTQCEGDHCGLFHITWPYWADAGKPTINGLSPDDPNAYPSCTNDPYCAAQTVQGYMKRYAQDCNGDGQINCYDYMAIHKGGYGCSGELPFNYVNTFNQCVAIVAQQQHQG